MIDPEYLALVEHGADVCVEGAGTRQVGSEGLLHHDPCALGQPGLTQGRHNGPGGTRRDAQVVQAPRVPRLRIQLRLATLDRGSQPSRAVDLGHIAQQRGELVPRSGHDSWAGELVAALLRDSGECSIVERLERGAQDPALRKQARIEQSQQTRQQLAAGEVTRGPEQDDDVRVEVAVNRVLHASNARNGTFRHLCGSTSSG